MPMKDINVDELNIAFFGTPDVAVYVLDELARVGILPTLIVTAPDKPKGRKLIVTPSPAKIWAEEHNLSIYQPEKLNGDAINTLAEEGPWDLFIVAAYGSLIPSEVLDTPKYGTLNVHPSLLPKLRGASPIQTAILEEDETGVTIMLVDEEMDHGPIVVQEKVIIPEWPPKASELQEILARKGGNMLAEIIPRWVTGTIETLEQDHGNATYTKKITKEDGEINLSDDAQKNFRKFQAYSIWPRTYFFTDLPADKAGKNGERMRVIITDAAIENGTFVIKKVIPEGGKEILYKQFLKK